MSQEPKKNHPHDRLDRRELNRLASLVEAHTKEKDRSIRFVLLLASIENEESDRLQYVSNISRETACSLMLEFVGGGDPDTLVRVRDTFNEAVDRILGKGESVS